MTTTLTYEEVTEALNKRVERLGADYIYERPSGDACVYSTPDKEPSCAVGDVFFQLAPALFDVLADREWTPSGSPLDDDDSGPYWTYGARGIFDLYADRVIASQTLQEALAALQRFQDGGHALSKAIGEFHDVYHRLTALGRA